MSVTEADPEAVTLDPKDVLVNSMSTSTEVKTVDCDAETIDPSPKITFQVLPSTHKDYLKLLPKKAIVKKSDEAVSFGRSENSDVRLNDVYCSRKHAEVYKVESKQGQMFYLKKVSKGSGNVSVNGIALACLENAQLNPGDKIKIESLNLEILDVQKRPQKDDVYELEIINISPLKPQYSNGVSNQQAVQGNVRFSPQNQRPACGVGPQAPAGGAQGPAGGPQAEVRVMVHYTQAPMPVNPPLTMMPPHPMQLPSYQMSQEAMNQVFSAHALDAAGPSVDRSPAISIPQGTTQTSYQMYASQVPQNQSPPPPYTPPQTSYYHGNYVVGTPLPIYQAQQPTHNWAPNPRRDVPTSDRQRHPPMQHTGSVDNYLPSHVSSMQHHPPLQHTGSVDDRLPPQIPPLQRHPPIRHTGSVDNYLPPQVPPLSKERSSTFPEVGQIDQIPSSLQNPFQLPNRLSTQEGEKDAHRPVQIQSYVVEEEQKSVPESKNPVGLDSLRERGFLP